MPADRPRPKTIEEIRIEIAKTDKLNQQVKKALLILVDEAGNNLKKEITDFNKILTNMEMWFNAATERIAGWYKRKTQLIVFLLAVLFTFALNIDTISISKGLSNDSALRASLVAAAQEAAKQPSLLLPSGQTVSQGSGNEPAGTGLQPPARNVDGIYKDLKKQVGEIQQLGIPLGWDIPFPGPESPKTKKVWWWVLKFFGLMLTVLAASLGAPFWFDILNKFISIRSAGKTPEEDPEPGKSPAAASSQKE